MIIGISMGQEICLILAQVSLSLLEEKPPDGSMWSGVEINARTLGENGKECQAEGEANVVT